MSGINHAAFDADSEIALGIAENISRHVPMVSTFLAHDRSYARELCHDHKYALGVRRLARSSGLKVNERWVDTNRCPIQGAWTEIVKLPWHDELQPAVDGLLKELILGTSPKYVITWYDFRDKVGWKRNSNPSGQTYRVNPQKIDDSSFKNEDGSMERVVGRF